MSTIASPIAASEQALTIAWPQRWKAEWVGAQPPRTVDALRPENTGPSGGDFARHAFRGTFELDAVPEHAPLRVTADSRYVLYVNGAEVGRGPVRSQPRRLRFDSYDAAPYLRDGVNRIVALVTYYGTANSFWQPSALNDTLGAASVMALEVDLGARWFVSGSGWDVRAMTAWSEPPRDVDGVPVESFDARLVEPGWEAGESGEWSPAHVQHAGHLGALAQTHPPTDPYSALLPRPIGALGGDVVTPLTASVGREAPAQDPGAHPVWNVIGRWADCARDLTDQPADSIAFSAPGASSRAIALDFGRIVAGHVGFALDAPRGTVVDLMYREVPPAGDDAEFSTPKTGARYIARGRDDRFSAQDVNGFRYAHLIVTVPESGDVLLRDFHVHEFLTRRSGDAFFSSSDDELDALYAAGIRTVELNSHDAYTDCPTREQRAWVGDGVVHQMVNLTTSDDWRLPAWYVELGNSPRPDGILPMSVVGEIESGQRFTIPDWSLYWVHGVHNLLRYTGDRQALQAAAPTVRRILEWFTRYLADDGVLADVPEWRLVDWSSILLDGESSILTAFWARALREYAEISDYLDNGGDARWARSLWQRARNGFEKFWDEDRGTYVDHVVDGIPQAPASQLAGAFAIVSRLVPADRIDRVVAWIGDESRHVTRSWIGGDGTYDHHKMLDQVRGVQTIDWDAWNEVVVAQPFGAFVVHDAYAVAGRVDLLIAEDRRWTAFLSGGYDTFGECWGWGTPAHGWSSTPTRDIVQYVLGVTPGSPGFATVRIAPAYGQPARMAARVPTPAGFIEIQIDGDSISVDTPVPGVLVRPDGSEVTLPIGATRQG